MSKERANQEDNDGKYQPKATVRHEKIAKAKKDEMIQAKEKIMNEKYAAKKAEAKRREEIKKLPKEERAAAKAKLKEDIAARKAVDKKNKEEYKAKVKAEGRRWEQENSEERSSKPVARSKGDEVEDESKVIETPKEAPVEESNIEPVSEVPAEASEDKKEE